MTAQGGADRCIKVLERLWGSSEELEEPMGRGIRWESSACWPKEYFLTHTDFKKQGLPCKIVSFLSLKILKQKRLDVKFPILKEENRRKDVCVCVRVRTVFGRERPVSVLQAMLHHSISVSRKVWCITVIRS